LAFDGHSTPTPSVMNQKQRLVLKGYIAMMLDSKYATSKATHFFGKCIFNDKRKKTSCESNKGFFPREKMTQKVTIF
jgi:hypothetical protein